MKCLVAASSWDLELEVVAEGVEDRATWDLLRDMGCTLIEGWHLARPMPIDVATAWLTECASRRTPVSVR